MENFTTFTIYKDRLISNVETIIKNCNCMICAMVKADGYGYGEIEISKILASYVDFFGVANCVEALNLRNNGIKNKILVCQIPNMELVENCLIKNISLTVTNIGQIDIIELIAKKIHKKAKLHIKINSGMNRLGEKNLLLIKKMVKKINSSPNLKLEGIFTHCGFSELEDKSLMYEQHTYFMNIVKMLSLSKNVIVHFANSGAFQTDKIFQHDMVRIGKNLYGVNANFAKNNLPLRPIFSLTTKVVQLSYPNENEFVGYGTKVIAKKNNNFAILPLGYADGYLSSYVGANVIINNKIYNISAVCMDLIIVDLKSDTVNLYDDALLIGDDNNNIIEVTKLSKISHNVASQVIANINKKRFNLVVL